MYTIDHFRQAIARTFPGPLSPAIEKELIRNLPSASSDVTTTTGTTGSSSVVTRRPVGVKGVLGYVTEENLMNPSIQASVADYWDDLVTNKAKDLKVKDHINKLLAALEIKVKGKKAVKIDAITKKINDILALSPSSPSPKKSTPEPSPKKSTPEPSPKKSTPEPSPKKSTPEPSQTATVIETITLPSQKSYDVVQGERGDTLLVIDSQLSKKNIVGKYVDGVVETVAKSDLSKTEKKNLHKDRKDIIEEINSQSQSIDLTDEELVSRVAADFASELENAK